MPRRILMVDDDRQQFDLIQTYFGAFRSERFDLDWAMTYESGLQMLLSGRYSACLLDYRLEKGDGLQLMREAISRGCRTPIIFLTSEGGSGVDTEAMNAGALDYLVKGEITVPSLERSLRYALKLGDTMEALNRLATHDTLTGLPNRREFDRILALEVDRARRLNLTFGLAIVDVDHFKPINDTHGHPAGDAVLRQIAERLQESAGAADIVARIGGEEFAMILVQVDRTVAFAAVQRARESIEGEPILVRQDLALFVTASAGIALFPSDADTGAALIAAADKALYAAKAAGRNRVLGPGDLP